MSILKRTIFYDFTGGVVRFWDWALVATTLGTMVEPFSYDRHTHHTPVVEFDPTDEIAKITDIRAMPIDKQQLVLSGGAHIHGGTLIPRVGR